MTASLRAEWLKLVTTRAFFGLVIAAALLTAFVNFGVVAQGPPPWSVTAEQFAQLTAVTAITLGLFSLIVGLRAFTEEFRYGTIVQTTFSDPSLTRTTLAKSVVAAAGAATVVGVSVAFSAVVVFAMTGGGGPLVGLPASVLGLLAGGALWAVLGVGLGALLRQPVAAMVTALLWVLVFENAAGLLLGPAASYLPGSTAQVLARGTVRSSELLVAAGILMVWTAALWTLGWRTLRRRGVA